MIKAIAKTLAALVAAAAAVILGLDGAGVMAASPEVRVLSVVASAALAAVTTIGAAWAEWRARHLGARRELADAQLTATVWAIVDQVGTGLDYRDLGIAAYRLQRAWWWPFVRRLRRVHRVRASRRPVTSNIRWRPGKGVIGACVVRREVVAVDFARMYAELGHPTAQEWPGLPDDVRLGLTFGEYVDLREKYAVVVASPVIDDTGPHARVRGCVALDGPPGRLADLTTEEVLGLLNSAAQGLLKQVL